MKFSLVQAEQVLDDLVVNIDGMTLLVDKYIVDQDYKEVNVGYSIEKGYTVTLNGKSYHTRTIVTRKPKSANATVKETSCSTSK